MATARYVLRGKITSADPAATGSMIELLVWLDHEANKTRSDMLEVVKAQYEREARKHGWQIAWHLPCVASPACAVQPNQLLFAFFGVRVFELTTSEAINPVSA